MAIEAVDIQPGVFRHGTDLEGAGRWRDVNLVRWRSGSLGPIGGWQERVKSGATLDKPVRGSLGWVDNSFDTKIAAGTYNKLFHISPSGVVTDITPAGFTAGAENAALNIGFGGGFYGTDYYGTQRISSGVYQEATTWSLDTWGEYLVACSVDDGKLYEWQLNTSVVAAQISNAPTSNLGLVTTAERFLFALGAGGNPRKVQWCDKEDNTAWTPSATNEAGDFELSTNGEILSGHRLRGKTLILTTTDAHTATYIGPQLVFQFERVGTSCGVISRQACIPNAEGAFWMGQKGFFMYNGSSVQEMQCDVLDYVFNDMNTAQRSKVFAMNNSQFGEAWWFYPSGGSNENDRYVIYNYKENYWNIGELARTSGFDAGVFRQPIMFCNGGKHYDHEIGYSHGGVAPHAESGPVVFGSSVVKVNEIIPDEKTQGEATLTFKTRFYPNGSESTHGPYTMSNPTSARFSGRQLRLRVNGTEFNNWRFGIPRLNVIPGGNR